MGRRKNPIQSIKMGSHVHPDTFARIRRGMAVEGNVSFDKWIRALMAREHLYRTQTRALHAELTKLRGWHLPFDGQAPALRPSEDDRYDDLLRRRP